MSEANVEIVKRGIDAYNRLDVDAVVELSTPDVAFVSVVFDLEGGGYHGREAIETLFGNIRDTWEELNILVEEIRDLDDVVLVLGRLEGRGRGSGVEVDAPYAVVVELRGGKVSRLSTYLDHGEALRAAGVSE
jgi:ketosteroid isomerase-like protein